MGGATSSRAHILARVRLNGKQPAYLPTPVTNILGGYCDGHIDSEGESSVLSSLTSPIPHDQESEEGTSGESHC